MLVPVAFTICGAAFGLGQGRVSTEVGLSQENLYGEGDKVAWGLVDDRGGDLAIFPAELVYQLRYGLPRTSFRDATEPFYERNYRTMAWRANRIPLGDARFEHTLRGMVHTKDGARVVAPRASALLSVQWPYATHLVVTAHAAWPTRVRVGRGGVLGVTWYGEISVGDHDTDAPVAIPAGGFDSGLLELVFECPDAADARLFLSSILLEDEGHYGPPL